MNHSSTVGEAKGVEGEKLLHIDWVNNSTLTELALVGMAYVLSALVGIERHRQVKSAGLRTHTLVGLGAAVFTLVSGYGFSSITTTDVVLDPSRIAAQIVSGVGFLGAGSSLCVRMSCLV